MEADLERVGKDRRDSYVDREEDRHDLYIALYVDVIALQRHGQHKVEDDNIVEGHCVEICEHAEEVLDISCRIYNVGHQNHIKEERRATTERHSVGDMTVLAVIKGVKRQNAKE